MSISKSHVKTFFKDIYDMDDILKRIYDMNLIFFSQEWACLNKF